MYYFRVYICIFFAVFKFWFMNGNFISIDEAIKSNMCISGVKECLYDKCVGCLHCSFAVAVGLHPHYGWYIQLCSLDDCSPLYKSVQLKLF